MPAGHASGQPRVIGVCHIHTCAALDQRGKVHRPVFHRQLLAGSLDGVLHFIEPGGTVAVVIAKTINLLRHPFHGIFHAGVAFHGSHYRRTHCHPGGGCRRPGPGNPITHFKTAGIISARRIHSRLLFTRAFQGLLLFIQRLPGFVRVLSQIPLCAAEFWCRSRTL